MSWARAGTPKEKADHSKIFLQWASFTLADLKVELNSLEDLRSGVLLVRLVERVCGVPASKHSTLAETPSSEAERQQNMQTFLDLMAASEHQFQSYSCEELLAATDSTLESVLWTLIRLQCAYTCGKPTDLYSMDEAILAWLKTNLTDEEKKIHVRSFRTCFRSGMLFLAWIDKLSPASVDWTRVDKVKPEENITYATALAQEMLCIPPLLAVGNIVPGSFDSQAVTTYMACFFFVQSKQEEVEALKRRLTQRMASRADQVAVIRRKSAAPPVASPPASTDSARAASGWTAAAATQQTRERRAVSMAQRRSIAIESASSSSAEKNDSTVAAEAEASATPNATAATVDGGSKKPTASIVDQKPPKSKSAASSPKSRATNKSKSSASTQQCKMATVDTCTAAVDPAAVAERASSQSLPANSSSSSANEKQASKPATSQTVASSSLADVEKLTTGEVRDLTPSPTPTDPTNAAVIATSSASPATTIEATIETTTETATIPSATETSSAATTPSMKKSTKSAALPKSSPRSRKAPLGPVPQAQNVLPTSNLGGLAKVAQQSASIVTEKDLSEVKPSKKLDLDLVGGVSPAAWTEEMEAGVNALAENRRLLSQSQEQLQSLESFQSSTDAFLKDVLGEGYPTILSSIELSLGYSIRSQ